MTERIVDFGDDGKADVRMAMAKQHGAQVRGEIVRCRDCKHHELPQPKNGWNGYCTTNKHDTVPDGFCKWGERKECE